MLIASTSKLNYNLHDLLYFMFYTVLLIYTLSTIDGHCLQGLYLKRKYDVIPSRTKY